MEFKAIYSAPHAFLFHPEHHPDRVGQVAMKGWGLAMGAALASVGIAVATLLFL